MRNQVWSGIAGLMMVLATSPALADIYKCRMPDGQVEISSQPCPGSAKTEISRPAEKITPEQREAAERELKRAREFIAQREAAAAAERTKQEAASKSAPTAPPPPPPPPVPVQEPATVVVVDPIARCMQDVERMGLSPAKREEMMSRCVPGGTRTTVAQPTTTTQKPATVLCTGKNCDGKFAPGK